MTTRTRVRGFFRLAQGKSLVFALQALAWKLRTALQKRKILWQEQYGRYTYADWIRENEPDPRVTLARSDPHFALCPVSDPAGPVLAVLEIPSGEYILRLDSGDQIASRLPVEAARFLEQVPEVEILYFDEDRLGPGGQGRKDPFFKPDWSPELLLSTGYLDHALFKRTLMDQARGQAGERAGWDELVFRCVELATGIGHLPQVLYHSHPVERDIRQKGEQASPSADRLKAIAAHLERSSLAVASAFLEDNGQVRVTWPFVAQKISIIIPTRDHVDLLKKCLESIQDQTDYSDYEILLVDSGSQEPETHKYYARLRKNSRIRIFPFPGPFNYSAANNLGAQGAAGEILLFLNNDTEVIDPGWLEELARWASRPMVGIVGGKLLYPDGTIQHAGIVIGMEGHGSHVFSGAREGDSGPFGSADWYRDYSAVTGACLAIRREVFAEIGGFDERYELVFNDIEICQRARSHGYRVVYTPYARLIHYEGRTRSRYIPAADIQLGYTQLKDAAEHGDPYYNPNLSSAVRIPTFRRRFEDPPGERLKAIAHFNPDINDDKRDYS